MLETTTTQVMNGLPIPKKGPVLHHAADAPRWAGASPAALAALRDWADASGDVVVGLDQEGRIVSANSAFDRCFAIRQSALTGIDAAAAQPITAPVSPALRGDPMSRWVPLLTGPRLARWTSELAGMHNPNARVHRLLAEGLRADGERFLLSATLVRPRADLPASLSAYALDEAVETRPALACIAALRTIDMPGSPPQASHRPWEPREPRRAGDPVEGVALRALIDAAIRSLPGVDRRRRYDLSLPSESVVLAVDPDRIRHALLEVLGNACRYAGADTSIRISARLDEGDDSTTYWVITVADRGVGMRRADAQRAFEPFWRGAATADLPGRGLGLALARWLVDEAGGWMELRSALGVGTEVDVWLPVVQG